MSMCLYLKSGPELELTRLAKDGDALANLGMSGFGGGGVGSLPQVEQLQKLAAAQMEKMVRLHGPQWEQQMKSAIEQYQRMLAAMKPAKAGGSKKTAAKDRPVGKTLDLHKSWHLLHYLFTGAVEDAPSPGGALMSGGREIGEDLGYGPARLLNPAETKAFATFLAPLSPEKLTKGLDVKKMSQLGLYAVSDNAYEVAEEVAEYFPKLKDYVENAASRGEGLLVWLM